MIDGKQLGFVMLAGAVAVAACGDSDEGTAAASTSATGSVSSSVSAVSNASSNSSSTATGTGGGGGSIDTQALCDAGEKKIIDCGGSFPGGSGGAGGNSGGFIECDGVDQCRAQCAIDASCNEIKFQSGNYVDCLYCCDNPHLCT